MIQVEGVASFCSFSLWFLSRQCLLMTRVALSSHSRLYDNPSISEAQKYLCALGAGFPNGLSNPCLINTVIS